MDAIKEGMLASAKVAEAAARIGERLLGQNTLSVISFSSQICTTREQSERLLSLGLKKETADCYWFYCDIAKEWKCTILSSTQVFKDYPTTIIPAYSLHRLAFLLNASPYPIYLDSNAYSDIIDDIEELIKHGEFNKEYLEE